MKHKGFLLQLFGFHFLVFGISSEKSMLEEERKNIPFFFDVFHTCLQISDLTRLNI